MYPIFVTDANDKKTEISSMPGQYRWSVDRLEELLEPLVEDGLRSIILFGVVEEESRKCDVGAFADTESSPVPRAIRSIREKFPDLYVACDVCLCGYTHHGHCGVLHSSGAINNTASINRLADISRAYAEAGAHMIAPSDMMDGRVGAIKAALAAPDAAGRDFGGSVSVMSYAVKYQSCYYGPFREAASSGAKFGDRSRYQLAVGARGLGLRALQRDLDEGADVVMVKPGGPFLDIVRDVRNNTHVPVAVYQVSGEYAMLYHAAQAGALNLDEAVMESLVGMRRAGADLLLTYYTPHVLQWLKEGRF